MTLAPRYRLCHQSGSMKPECGAEDSDLAFLKQQATLNATRYQTAQYWVEQHDSQSGTWKEVAGTRTTPGKRPSVGRL
jgi:hypothetical protein